METPTEFPSKGKKPSFFKVFMQDFSTQLRIPPEFIKKFGKDVPNKIGLKVSFGESWEVEVERVEKNVYFKKGWEIFVEDNNLEYGDFMIFKYSANSTFKVTIYGTTCCVKEVPVARDRSNIEPFGKENQRQVKDQRKRKWIQVEDGIHVMEQSSEIGYHSQSEILKGAAKDVSGLDGAKVDKRLALHIGFESSDYMKFVDLEKPKHKGRVEASAIQYTTSIQKSRKSTNLSPDTAIGFNSQYPFFQVKLKLAYASGSYLGLPTNFFRIHLEEKDHQEIKLQISKNSWTVKVHVLGGEVNKSMKRGRIIKGWREFVRDNDLRLGDVCIFEMIKRDEVVFNVHIYGRV